MYKPNPQIRHTWGLEVEQLLQPGSQAANVLTPTFN